MKKLPILVAVALVLEPLDVHVAARQRQLAHALLPQMLARRWGRAHPRIPSDTSSDLLPKFILVRYALSRIGLRDAALNAQIRTAAKRFSAQDLLGFNPVSEPPPSSPRRRRTSRPGRQRTRCRRRRSCEGRS